MFSRVILSGVVVGQSGRSVRINLDGANDGNWTDQKPKSERSAKVDIPDSGLPRSKSGLFNGERMNDPKL